MRRAVWPVLGGVCFGLRVEAMPKMPCGEVSCVSAWVGCNRGRHRLQESGQSRKYSARLDETSTCGTESESELDMISLGDLVCRLRHGGELSAVSRQ